MDPRTGSGGSFRNTPRPDVSLFGLPGLFGNEFTLSHGPEDLTEKRNRNEFVIKPCYRNTLPDVPCEPRHITVPLDVNDFRIKSQDLKPFYEQATDWDVGVTIDLVGSTTQWKIPEAGEMNEADRRLLVDDSDHENSGSYKREALHKKKVPWLRRTEYISSEATKFKTTLGDKLEYRVDKAIGRKIKQESDKFTVVGEELNDANVRVKRIEQSFEDAKKQIAKHPSNPSPGVYPVEVIPIFPDFDLWKYSFAQLKFDPPPSVPGYIGEISDEQMAGALLKAISYDDDEPEERVGYFVSKPKKDSEDVNVSHDLPSTEPDTPMEYGLARDYAFRKSSNSTQLLDTPDTYVFIEKEDKVTYCDIDKRINLKRYTKPVASLKNAVLYTKYRPFVSAELTAQVNRDKMLSPLGLDKDEDTASSITHNSELGVGVISDSETETAFVSNDLSPYKAVAANESPVSC